MNTIRSAQPDNQFKVELVLFGLLFPIGSFILILFSCALVNFHVDLNLFVVPLIDLRCDLAHDLWYFASRF